MIIAYDAAGTLMRVQPSVGHVYARHAAAFGVTADPAAINAAFGATYGRMRADAGGASPFHTSEAAEQRWWRDLVHRVFDSLNPRPGFGDRYDAFFDTLFDAFADPGVWAVYPDVEPAVRTMAAAGWRQCVGSNWDSRLPRLLGQMPWAAPFEAVHTSASLGYSKPHPEFFHELARRIGAPPESIVYVGNEADTDVVPARAAGLIGVLLDRKGAVEAAVPRIGALTGLPACLARIGVAAK